MRRLGVVGSVVLLLFSIGGFVVALVLNAMVFSSFDAYGEVPIPGTETLHLPQGQVTVSFHTLVSNPEGGFTVSGNDLPIPDLNLTITPPTGVAEPAVSEHSSAATTDGNDAHQQVWVAQIPQTGDYTVTTDGKVSGFISPRLAFGHTSPYGYLPWVFVGVFVVALLTLIVSMRLRRRPGQPALQPVQPFATPQPFVTSEPYPPANDVVRIELLNTLANLHASGALTDKEFDEQKRRILDG
jgi:Short C-terminal domain